jgi:hypothetical protein
VFTFVLLPVDAGLSYTPKEPLSILSGRFRAVRLFGSTALASPGLQPAGILLSDHPMMGWASLRGLLNLWLHGELLLSSRPPAVRQHCTTRLTPGQVPEAAWEIAGLSQGIWEPR